MSRRRTIDLVMAILGSGLGMCAGADAAVETVWSYDFGAAKVRKLKAGMETVEDRLAPGGKALRLSPAPRYQYLPGVRARDLVLAGAVSVTVYVRAEGLRGLSRELAMVVTLRDQAAGAKYRVGPNVYETHSPATYNTPVHIHAIRVPSDKYVAVRRQFAPVQLPAEPRPYTLSMTGRWALKPKGRTPVVWLARVEVNAHGTTAPYISEVYPDRVYYRPGRQIKTWVSVVNPTDKPFEGRLAVEELCGLETRKEVAEQTIRVEPGKREELGFTWGASKPEAGREVTVGLLDGQREIDRHRAYFGIARNPSFLVTTGQFAGGMYATGPEGLNRRLAALRQMKARGQHRGEIFSWSYNELGSMMPPGGEDPYLATEGVRWASFKKMKRNVQMMKEVGVSPITYLAGPAWGIGAYDLYQRHPEWFAHSKSGEVGMYDMEKRAAYMRRGDFDFVPYGKRMFWGSLIATHPEVRRYIADQIIKTAKEMGWEGGRWDVWNMDVGAGARTIDGKIIASTREEADRLTAESLRVLKELVAKELPDFTWGYNKVSPERNKNTPLTLAEKCRGGGWLLDEVICSYQRKTSPYHYWAAYRDRILTWTDHCRKLGGIYNPYPFRRGGGKYPIDKVYESIICQAAGGRYGAYGPYESDAGLVGRIGRVVFRYSNTFFSWDYDLQKDGEKLVQVDAPETLWWKQMVFRNKSPAGRPQTIVHLVNSPLSEEVEENPDSIPRPALKDVKVVCHSSARKVWVITAEPFRLGDEPGVQAVEMELAKEGDGVSVTVPSVLFWKVVVFEH